MHFVQFALFGYLYYFLHFAPERIPSEAGGWSEWLEDVPSLRTGLRMCGWYQRSAMELQS